MNPLISHPEATEHAAFYRGYLARVNEETDPIAALNVESRFWEEHIGCLRPNQADFAYAPGKWTLTELTRHLADTETVFTYRLLCALRGEPQSLPGFDENAYQKRASADGDTLESAMKSLKAQRGLWEALVGTVRPEQETRTLVANGHPVSVRALVWMVCGHARHHREIVLNHYFNHPDFSLR